MLEPYRIDTCTNNVHEGEHCSVFVVYCKVALGRMIGYEFVFVPDLLQGRLNLKRTDATLLQLPTRTLTKSSSRRQRILLDPNRLPKLYLQQPTFPPQHSALIHRHAALPLDCSTPWPNSDKGFASTWSSREGPAETTALKRTG